MTIVNYLPDIFIGLVILWAMVNGYTRGFVRSFLHAIGWVLSIVLAFVWSPKVQEWLLANTEIYDKMKGVLDKRFSDSLPQANDTFTQMPQALTEGIGNFTGDFSDAMATRGADILFSVLSFVLVILAVKLVFFVLVSLLSKKNRGGITGAMDGILGVIAGGITGLLLVYVMLALLIPVSSLAGPQLSEFLSAIINDSWLTKELYYNNIIVVIFQDFLTQIR
jgi:uncharacterized membrane protein required for colicin V production